MCLLVLFYIYSNYMLTFNTSIHPSIHSSTPFLTGMTGVTECFVVVVPSGRNPNNDNDWIEPVYSRNLVTGGIVTAPEVGQVVFAYIWSVDIGDGGATTCEDDYIKW
jgi:hypothetical protein